MSANFGAYPYKISYVIQNIVELRTELEDIDTQILVMFISISNPSNIR